MHVRFVQIRCNFVPLVLDRSGRGTGNGEPVFRQTATFVLSWPQKSAYMQQSDLPQAD